MSAVPASASPNAPRSAARPPGRTDVAPADTPPTDHGGAAVGSGTGPAPERMLRAGYDALDRHRLASAVHIFHEAATVAAMAGDPGQSCEATLSAGVAGLELGLWLLGLGLTDAAPLALATTEVDARRALGLARRLDRCGWDAMANATLALAAVALGRAADGRRRGQVALLDARSAVHPKAELVALLALGAAAWRLGDAGDGLRLLTLAERNATRAGDDRWLLEVLREQLRVLEADGAVDQAYPLARRIERLVASLVQQ